MGTMVFCWILVIASFGISAYLIIKKLMVKPALQPLTFQPTAKSLVIVFAVAVLSRIALAGLIYAIGAQAGEAYPGIFEPMARWDAPHYLYLAQNGYTSNPADGDPTNFIVFFPLFPLAVAGMNVLVQQIFISASLVSWLCCGGACVLLYMIVGNEFGTKAAVRSVVLLLIFPVSLFLGAAYTESLFLLLSLGCIYALRKRKWWIAAVCGMLAGATRNIGIILALPFFVEWLQCMRGARGEARKKLAPKLLIGLLIPMGLVVYLMINHALWGDAFHFMQVQQENWNNSFGPVPEAIQTSINYAVSETNPKVVNYLWRPQVVVMITTMAALPLLVRKLRISDAVYTAACIFVLFSAAWPLSAFRYVMSVAPVFFALGAYTRRRWLFAVLVVLSIVGLLYMTCGFARGAHVM